MVIIITYTIEAMAVRKVNDNLPLSLTSKFRRSKAKMLVMEMITPMIVNIFTS